MKIPSLSGVKLLGDPHLGKTFKTGVPLHRRGERERHQWGVFHESLHNVSGYKLHVNMGDLFDDFIVPYRIIWDAAHEYLSAAEDNPDVRYIIHIGNHDESKDVDKVSAFRVFSGLVAHCPSITVVQGAEPFLSEMGTLHLPWHPFQTSRAIATRGASLAPAFAAAFGHWDHRDFGDEDHENVVPVAELKDKTKVFVSGHEHTPAIHVKDGCTLYFVGSMLPYSHGEDPKELIYVTRDLSEIDDINDFKDKSLRLNVPAGEIVPEGWPDVPLQFQAVFEKVDVTHEVGKSEDFNFEDLMGDTLKEFDVSEGMRTWLTDKYKDSRKDL